MFHRSALMWGVIYITLYMNTMSACRGGGGCHLIIGAMVTYLFDNSLSLSLSREITKFPL